MRRVILFQFFAITSIRLIGSRQNLAWTYYLTLGTSLRNNFSFFSKSKMATGGQNLRRVIFFQCFCNNLDPVHRIQTKFGMDILLDPRNKPAEEFFIFLKIQDGRRRSKIATRYTFSIFSWNPTFNLFFSMKEAKVLRTSLL